MFTSNVMYFVGTLLLIYAIAAVALNLLQGYAGLLSLALAANFASGAYAFAIAAGHYHQSTLVALLIAAVAAAAIQGVLSLLTARLADLYYVLATLALQLVLLAVVDNWTSLTGGPAGLFGLPSPEVFGIDLFPRSSFLAFCAVWFVLCLVMTWAVKRSVSGLSLRALRDQPLALIATGRDIRSLRLFVNGYYAAWFGVAGGLYAAFLNTVTPLSFDMLESVTFQALVIVGGSGNFWGPLVGVLLLIGVPEVLRYSPALGISETSLAAGRDIMYGLLLIVVMRFRPSGALAMRVRDAGPAWAWRDPAQGELAAAAASDRSPARTLPALAAPAALPGATGDILTVEDAHVRFGGVAALRGASIAVERGKVTGVIGPNGAGKSSLFNVISGYVAPDSGQVTFEGRRINRFAPHRRVQMGMGRTFQDLKLFGSLTVRQNVYLAAVRHQSDPRAAVEEWVDYFDLGRLGSQPVGSFDYGTQKLVALARTMATRPRLLLLDEPASGLDSRQVAELADVVRALVDQTAISVCLVEHNMDLIRMVSDSLYAMHDGLTIASGEPDSVLRNTDVVRIYLGA